MKKKFLSILLFLIFSTKGMTHSEHYKDINVLEYELFRNNQSIGYHNYKFESNENYLIVKSLIDFKITKLGIDLYSYNGTTDEEYQQNQLINFSSKTNQNKKIKNTKITFDKKKDKSIIIVVGKTFGHLEQSAFYEEVYAFIFFKLMINWLF